MGNKKWIHNYNETMKSSDHYNFRLFRQHNLLGKKNRNVIVLICTLFPAAGRAQEKVPDWGIKFSGYVKNDIYYDTRQSVQQPLSGMSTSIFIPIMYFMIG